jgi:hypothetical protein
MKECLLTFLGIALTLGIMEVADSQEKAPAKTPSDTSRIQKKNLIRQEPKQNNKDSNDHRMDLILGKPDSLSREPFLPLLRQKDSTSNSSH